MTDIVKIKMRDGAREIELEGVRGDVDELLARWWQQPQKAPPAAGAEASTFRNLSFADAAKNQNGDSPTDQTFDSTAVANQILEDERIEKFEKRVINNGTLRQKASFILWYTQRDLTPTEIRLVLDAMNINIDASNFAKVFRASRDFIQSGKDRAPRYRLSAPARAAFQTWLMADGQ